MIKYIKIILIGLFSVLLIFSSLFIGSIQSLAAGNFAPNIYISPIKTKESDILMIDWKAIDNAKHTYWAVENWNNGYAGFQQKDGYRTIHFALWDPVGTDETIKAEYLDENTKTERFGGEGTGQNAHAVYNWEVDEWYTTVVRSWQEDGHTKYGHWVKDEQGNWLQSVILDYPVPDLNFKWGHSLFQEDYTASKNEKRSFQMKNSYARSIEDGNWISYDEQKISTNASDNQNWNGGATDDYFWGEAGGSMTSQINNYQTFKINQPKEPNTGSIDLEKFNLEIENDILSAKWELKPTSSPQFKAQLIVKNNGEIIKQFDEIKSYEEEFTTNYNLKENDEIYLMITDLFDNQKEFVYGFDQNIDTDNSSSTENTSEITIDSDLTENTSEITIDSDLTENTSEVIDEHQEKQYLDNLNITSESLPQTGEKKSYILLFLGTMILTLIVYISSKNFVKK